MNPTLLDLPYLESVVLEKRESYAQATPVPNTVIENFLSKQVLEQAIKEYPAPGKELQWRHQGNHGTQMGKFGNGDLLQWQATLRALVGELSSAPFIALMEKLTGINQLIPDIVLSGGGLQQSVRGGYLNIHKDFTRHKQWGLERRVNIVLFLNDDWKEEYGGHIELWSDDMTRCVQRYLPGAGNCVIFDIANAPHGHPYPLLCPDNMTRKTLLFQYYTPVGEGIEPTTPRRFVQWSNFDVQPRVENYMRLLENGEIGIAGLEISAYLGTPEARQTLKRLGREFKEASLDFTSIITELRSWGARAWLRGVLELCRQAPAEIGQVGSAHFKSVEKSLTALENNHCDDESRLSTGELNAILALTAGVALTPPKIALKLLRNEMVDIIHAMPMPAGK